MFYKWVWSSIGPLRTPSLESLAYGPIVAILSLFLLILLW